MTTTLTREDVEEAYKLFLGRAAESEESIQEKLKNFFDKMELWRSFVLSEEFKSRQTGVRYREPPLPVQVHCNSAYMEALFKRVYEAWQKLGAEEPYWSVLTHDQYRSSEIDQNKEKFFASGAADAQLIDIFAARSDVTVPTGVCLELGCGVARITEHLAAKFSKVYGLDISSGNLNIARNRLAERKIKNVVLRQVYGLNDFDDLPQADVFFCLIVLQHNPPPIQYQILHKMLGKVKPNGLCLFQAPSRSPGYQFEVNSYLKSSEQGMEMHCLPMHEVLRTLEKLGFTILEVAPDTWTGQDSSFTYFAQRTKA